MDFDGSKIFSLNDVINYMRSMKSKCVDHRCVHCVFNRYNYDPVGFVIQDYLTPDLQYYRLDLTGNPLEAKLESLGFTDEDVALLLELQIIHDNVPLYYWRRHLSNLRKLYES
jgi:hypothetical protein